MNRESSPIIVLDSGLGGLTVLRAIRAVLPGEDLVYFGDTARLPYGSKTGHTVTQFVKQIIAYLRPLNPKHVVIACNTASAVALSAVRAAFPSLSISGVVQPGAKAAVVAAGAKRVPIIGVIATEATIRSKAYERAIIRRRNHARILMRPTPLLVPLIEEGRTNDDAVVKLALRQYLEPLVRKDMDVLVLGCTHYPIYKDAIARVLGSSVRVIDSAQQCADDVARRLWSVGVTRAAYPAMNPVGVLTSRRPMSMRRRGPGQHDAQGPEDRASIPIAGAAKGSLRCYVTDDAQRFGRLASRFLGSEIDAPTCVSPDLLYEALTPHSAAISLLRRPA
jgi:glutamate racemase